MSDFAWSPWSPEPFKRAEKERKPVLLDLPVPWSKLSRALEAAYSEPSFVAVIRERFVCVRADAEERPDVWARLGRKDMAPAVMYPDGTIIERPSYDAVPDLAKALERIAADYAAPAPRRPAPVTPVWTGAVGPSNGAAPPDPAWPASVVAALKAARGPGIPCADCLEMLLYAAREWNDEDARRNLVLRLHTLADSPFNNKDGGFAELDSERHLSVNARFCRLFWEAYALTGNEAFREQGRRALDFILSLYQPGEHAFRSLRPASGIAAPAEPCYADSNAMAVLALLKASSFIDDKGLKDMAQEVLTFLQSLWREETGMAHFRPREGRPEVTGLLGDAAWAMLAFSETFLMTGHKSYRDLADRMLRHLFQSLWEREHGGFLDRAIPDETGILGAAIVPPELNAVAFEASWRLHHLMGNANYRRWTEAGCRRAKAEAAQSQCASASLARLADMMAKGRLDLELVGRLGDAKTEGLLAALHRHYLPRRIISFVDPDDQDYILAHKLQAPSYPRLFGCIELRRKTDTDDPSMVSELLKSLA